MTTREPTVTSLEMWPVTREPRNTSVPRPTGTASANHISSSVQATGRKIATTTASSVRAIMISRKVRLPRPLPPGTLIAR